MSSEKVEHTHIIDYHIHPAVLRQRLKDIVDKFSHKLSNIENYYINMKMNPNIGSYRREYDTRLRRIHRTQSDLFEEHHKINKERNDIAARLQQYVDAIQEEKKTEEMYKKKIEYINQVGTGSAGLRKNMTDTYKLQYASNFFMILGIILSSIIIYIVFAKKIISGEVSIQPKTIVGTPVPL